VRKIEDNLITPVPCFTASTRTFDSELEVGLTELEDNYVLYWGQPQGKKMFFEKYLQPKKITSSTSFVAYAEKDGEKSFEEEAEYIEMPSGRSVKVAYPYNLQYTAGGDKALINTLRGTENFMTGNWQGYWGVDLDAVVDLGREQNVRRVGAGFLQDENSWIFMPEWVTFEASTDSVHFKKLGTVKNNTDPKQSGGIVKDFSLRIPRQKIRYLHVVAKNRGICPDWHKGAGEPAWIMVDEIWVK
jgi:hypothetical protein